jgi:hypothetical protein
MLTQHDPVLRQAQSTEVEAVGCLDRDLGRAISSMTQIDSQNETVTKCVKFTSTLRMLLQSIGSSILSPGHSGVTNERSRRDIRLTKLRQDSPGQGYEAWPAMGGTKIS